MESFESLFSMASLISWLGGILVSLVVFKFDYLGKKEWFGNTCSAWVGIISVAAIVALLIFGFYWFVPCVLLIPVGTVVWRWCKLKQRQKTLLKSKESLDQDVLRYEFYEWLSQKELFRWEVRRFLLPSMDVLFEIGAIRKLDEELKRLEDYKDWYEWKRLMSFVCWNRHEYQEMIDLLKSYENDKHLNESERARTVINMFSAYRNQEDKEGVEIYAKKLEKMLFDRKLYWIEVFDDLMYFYDEKKDEEKIERIKAIIKNLNIEEYCQLLNIYDVIYFYNRRHGKIDENKKLLDFMVEKSRLIRNEEQKKIFEIRLLKLYYENDYDWKEYSVKLFNDADTYLNFSDKVAFEYLRAVNLVMLNSRMQNLQPGIGINELYSRILKCTEEYVEEFDIKLLELPDDFLYRKKEMLMLKMEYLKASANERLEFTGYVTSLNNTLHKIISLCEKNGDESEKLHFLVVLADEMMAYRDDITTFKKEKARTPVEQTAISKINDEELYFAQVEAVECVQEINQTLKMHHYDRTLAYVIFYAAYLNMKLNDQIMAKQMLVRFHATGVDIKHYTIAVQKLYEDLKMQLEMQ